MEIRRGDVVVVPLEGQVSEAQFYFLRRAVKAAESGGASAIILDIDTPGGALSATEKMCASLLKSKVPVYAYINPNAASAGALIAMATRGIYMAPVSAIGAAAPVMGTGQEMEQTMNAKVVSYYSGYFRSVASQNGYNPELVDAFMNLDKEVKIGDRVINPKGAILTLSAQEAVEKIDGKPVLASGIADTIEDVRSQIGLPQAAIANVEPSGFESLAQWITVLAPMFLMGGIIGAYIEFKTPGFGVAGALAALCFLIFFTGHYVAGLTGFEVLAVFVLGVVLVLVELVFFPGVVVLAAGGVALMLGSMFFAMVDFYPGRPFEFSPEVLLRPVLNFAGGMGLAMVGAALVARYFPELPLFRRLVLSQTSPAGPSLTPPVHAVRNDSPDVGATGVAVSALRPAGRAEFAGRVFDVVSDGEFVEPGGRVRVLRSGLDALVVERSDGA